DFSARLRSITYGFGSPAAATWTYTYNSGNTVSTDPNGHKTTYYYDVFLRVTKVVDDNGNPFQTAWNSDNHATSSTDGKGQVTSFGYDATNQNLTSVGFPTGATASRGSYSLINGAYYPSSSTDTQGNALTYSYDAKGN